MLNLICGIFPFVSACMISSMRENSHPLLLWLGIVRILQTMILLLILIGGP